MSITSDLRLSSLFVENIANIGKLNSQEVKTRFLHVYTLLSESDVVIGGDLTAATSTIGDAVFNSIQVNNNSVLNGIVYANNSQLRLQGGALVANELAVPPVDPTGTSAGVVYVKNTIPNSLVFVDNSGNEHSLISDPDLASVLAVGNVTGGTDIVISTADSLTSELDLLIVTPDRSDATATGQIMINAGTQTGTGAGGPATVNAGNSTTNTGGNASFLAGNGVDGGVLTIRSGDGTSGLGGDVQIASGNSTTNATGTGALMITGGTASGPGATGGIVTMEGGQGQFGGDVTIQGGHSTSGTPGQLAGHVILAGGTADNLSNQGTVIIGQPSRPSLLTSVGSAAIGNAGGTVTAGSTGLAGHFTVNAASTLTVVFDGYSNGDFIAVQLSPADAAAGSGNSYVSATNNTSFDVTNPDGSAQSFYYFVIQVSTSAI